MLLHNTNIQSRCCRNVSALGSLEHTLEPVVWSTLHFLYKYKVITSIALKHKSNTRFNNILSFARAKIEVSVLLGCDINQCVHLTRARRFGILKGSQHQGSKTVLPYL